MVLRRFERSIRGVLQQLQNVALYDAEIIQRVDNSMGGSIDKMFRLVSSRHDFRIGTQLLKNGTCQARDAEAVIPVRKFQTRRRAAGEIPIEPACLVKG